MLSRETYGPPYKIPNSETLAELKSLPYLKTMRNILFLGIFVIFFLFDVVTDFRDGISLTHIWHEVILFMISIVALVWQIWTIIKREKQIQNLSKELLESKQSYQDWINKTQDSAQKLRTLIDQQFDSWQLSVSEKDVALLLIKGLAMKEIAEIRSTQEKTVRQQAANIYRKAGLAGRQELSAFFLEDILSSPIHSN